MLRVCEEQWRVVDTNDTNVKECATAQTSDGCDGVFEAKVRLRAGAFLGAPIERARGNAKTKEPR